MCSSPAPPSSPPRADVSTPRTPHESRFVDGVREAHGKTVGSSSLDGLRIGCDHTSTFFLKGSVAEIRLYSCHLGDGPRAQMEAALALQYGLNAPPEPVSPRPRGGVFTACLRRPMATGRTSSA